MKALVRKRSGLTRTEIAKAIGKKSGGALSEMLASLENSGFIRHQCPLGNRKDETLYRLDDPFCRCYLTFVEDNADHHFWQNSRNEGRTAAWRGLSFEELCMKHVDRIKNALRVGGVVSSESTLTPEV